MNHTLQFGYRATLAVGIIVGIFVAPGIALARDTAGAQSPKVVSKVVADNERVRVLENRYEPGATNSVPPAPFMRVVRVLKGGTLLRTYVYGSTETVSYKTGETVINRPSAAYTARNIGNTEIVLHVVVLKADSPEPSEGLERFEGAINE